MAFEKTTGLVRSFLYYDSSGNPIAPYTPVSLLTTGLPTGYSVGEVVGLPTISGTPARNTTQLIGVTLEWAYNGRQVPVQIDGVAYAIANAGIAVNGIVFAAANGTRTADQAPFANLPMIRPLVRPGQSVTLNVSLVDDVTITPQSGSANLIYYPLGIALSAASAQYDLIQILLMTQPFYA
jgi:hypothetical protein